MTFDDLFTKATGFNPYRWQRMLALREAPAHVILAPTGAGKTEAVLLDWLWRRRFHPDRKVRESTPRRLVLALPMRVLVEQTATRVKTALGRLRETSHVADEIAVHQLMGGAADDSWVLAPSADAVLVGTIDMLLSRALNRGFGRGRASWPIDFGLLNNDCVWVLDEVQLMDAAVATSCQLQAFRSSFGVAAPVRTAWMSATLEPSWIETIDHDVPPEERFASVESEDRRGELGVRLSAPKVVAREHADPTRPDQVAEIVLREHAMLADVPDAPRLTLALVNTVERAVALYRVLQERAGDGVDLVLLHSRFRPADRQRHVEHLLEQLPEGGRIVVSTQVIEAGIDLDAGAVTTELAPWASLVQRAGRLNRAGTRRSSPAPLVWIDPGEEALRKLHRPYDEQQLVAARAALLELEGASFSPEGIEEYLREKSERRRQLLGERPLSLLLRRPDVLDLFDTDPTLDGDDPDVGRFIRVSDDLDVGVAWRDLGEDPNDPPQPLPARDEVCAVPVWEGKALIKLKPYRWNYYRRRWEHVGGADRLVPGDLLLLPAAAGGYSAELGWTGDKRHKVSPVLLTSSEVPDSDADDAESLAAGRWITLEEHTAHVVDELEQICASLPLEDEWSRALLLAARVHDVGKAHPEFQRRLSIWADEEPRAPLKPYYVGAWRGIIYRFPGTTIPGPIEAVRNMENP